MNVDPERFEQLEQSVKRIETAVCGDETAGITGLVKRVAKLEKWKKRVTLYFAFITGGAAAIYEGGKSLLKKHVGGES